MNTDRKFWVMLLVAAIGVGGLVGLSYAEVKKGDVDMELAFGGNFDFGNGTTGAVSLDLNFGFFLSNNFRFFAGPNVAVLFGGGTTVYNLGGDFGASFFLNPGSPKINYHVDGLGRFYVAGVSGDYLGGDTEVDFGVFGVFGTWIFLSERAFLLVDVQVGTPSVKNPSFSISPLGGLGVIL